MNPSDPVSQAGSTPRPLTGRLDRADRQAVTGWALDPFAPQSRVALAIKANGEVIGRIIADLHRPDLEQAGKGDGRCSFRFATPKTLAPDLEYRIEVCRESDDRQIPGSPIVLPPIEGARPKPVPVPAPPPPVQEAVGNLDGSLDSVSRQRVTGWAQDPDHPARRVGLAVSIDGRVVGRLLADRFRPDLQLAGIGDGHYAFDFMLPKLSPFARHEVRLKREVDGRDLPGSPFILEPAGTLDADTETGLAGLLADIDTDDGERRALAFLAEQTELMLARRAERDSSRLARQAQAEFRRRWAGSAQDAADMTPSPEALRPRVLFVDEYVPFAGRDAGSVAILSHMRTVAALGYEVSFVAARALDAAEKLKALAEGEGVTVFGTPFYYSVEDVLKRQAGTFDVVYLHRIVNARAYLALVQIYHPKARIIYSVADLHHVRLARQGEIQQRPELVAHSRAVAFTEFAAAAQAHAVITHSPVEAKLLGERVPANKVHVVPWAVPVRPNTVPFADRSGLAVISQFGHPPNPDSVYWLTRHVMPLIWAEEPEFRCVIAGYGWAPDSLPNRDERIEIVGSVDDLMEVFSRVRLTVAPLRFGAGVKGKVLESFAAGIPCAMSAVAAEGIPLPPVLQALVAENAEEMARIILKLHCDEAANAAAAEAGLALIAAETTEERVLEAMAAILPKAP
jgi:glycosyltransferase involved in cell wall biosynthesis